MIGQVIGNYRIVAELGRGGMGVVYRAEHVQLGRPAALKVLLPQMSSDAQIVQRFFNEARAASSIDHPGIVEIYDYGRHTDGSAFIVMALLKGESLDHRLIRPIAPLEAASLIAQVAGALAAAHARGIIHRDLKPDNIFLVPNELLPGGIQVKLLDFGIAKLADERASGFRTQTGILIGTPAYMSPEQCMGSPDLDHRTDLYSVGCILYHMLCGRPPFLSDQGTGVMIAMHLRDPVPDPRALAPHLPEALVAITLRLLEKQPGARFQTAQELRQALVAAGAIAPMTAPGAVPDMYGATVASVPPAPGPSGMAGVPGVSGVSGARSGPPSMPHGPSAYAATAAVGGIATGPTTHSGATGEMTWPERGPDRPGPGPGPGPGPARKSGRLGLWLGLGALTLAVAGIGVGIGMSRRGDDGGDRAAAGEKAATGEKAAAGEKTATGEKAAAGEKAATGARDGDRGSDGRDVRVALGDPPEPGPRPEDIKPSVGSAPQPRDPTAEPPCPAGQLRTDDTRGQCCWPGQAWSSAKKRCIGAPACPPGTRATGEQCVARAEADPGRTQRRRRRRRRRRPTRGPTSRRSPASGSRSRPRRCPPAARWSCGSRAPCARRPASSSGPR